MAEPSPATGAPARRTGLALGLGALDQAVSGATNVLISVAAARALDPHDFGTFGIAAVVYVLGISALRALVSEPALVQAPEGSSGRPVGSGLLLGGAFGAAVAVAGVAVGGEARAPLVALGLLFPALVVQDVARYLAFASGRVGRALLADGLWLGLQVGGLVLVTGGGGATATKFVVVWAGAGAIAGLVMGATDPGTLAGPSLRWVRSCWGFSWRYLVSFASSYGTAYGVTIALGAVSGAAAVGALRGAQLLLSPLTMVLAASVNVLAVRISRTGLAGAPLRSRMLGVSGGLSALALALVAVGLAAPEAAGRVVLGDSWSGARALLVPAGVQSVMLGVWAGAKVGLTGARAVRDTVALDVRLAPLLVVAPMVGAVADDASGFLWGLAATHVVIAAAWWGRFLRVCRAQETVRAGVESG